MCEHSCPAEEAGVGSAARREAATRAVIDRHHRGPAVRLHAFRECVSGYSRGCTGVRCCCAAGRPNLRRVGGRVGAHPHRVVTDEGADRQPQVGHHHRPLLSRDKCIPLRCDGDAPPAHQQCGEEDTVSQMSTRLVVHPDASRTTLPQTDVRLGRESVVVVPLVPVGQGEEARLVDEKHREAWSLGLR